jgi:hypothetical protein
MHLSMSSAGWRDGEQNDESRVRDRAGGLVPRRHSPPATTATRDPAAMPDDQDVYAPSGRMRATGAGAAIFTGGAADGNCRDPQAQWRFLSDGDGAELLLRSVAHVWRVKALLGCCYGRGTRWRVRSGAAHNSTRHRAHRCFPQPQVTTRHTCDNAARLTRLPLICYVASRRADRAALCPRNRRAPPQFALGVARLTISLTRLVTSRCTRGAAGDGDRTKTATHHFARRVDGRRQRAGANATRRLNSHRPPLAS